MTLEVIEFESIFYANIICEAMDSSQECVAVKVVECMFAVIALTKKHSSLLRTR